MLATLFSVEICAPSFKFRAHLFVCFCTRPLMGDGLTHLGSFTALLALLNKDVPELEMVSMTE